MGEEDELTDAQLMETNRLSVYDFVNRKRGLNREFLLSNCSG